MLFSFEFIFNRIIQIVMIVDSNLFVLLSIRRI